MPKSDKKPDKNPDQDKKLDNALRKKQRLVVIGNGMAGMKTVEEVLTNDPEQFEITVFGAEPYGNYNRIMLSPVLCGEKSINEIMINSREWYSENNITLHAGQEKTVTDIDRRNKRVTAVDGTYADYDRLLIATGSNPFMLRIPGHDLDGVIAFRDIYDVEKMVSYSNSHKHAVVLGGGLLGLEAANGLAQRGMKVTVAHNMETLLNVQLDKQAGKLLQKELEERGINFMLDAQIQQIENNGNGHAKAALFADGSRIPCDLFVMAIGVRPNVTLAQSAGLQCERGILVSDTLQTYDPSIYAVGECIQHRGATFGMVAPLFEQAKVCANHLSEHGMAGFKSLPVATKLKVTGINLFSVGDFLGDDKSCESIIFNDDALKVYKKLVLRENRLVGVVLYGDTSQGAWYQQLLEQKIDVSAMRHLLIFGEAYAWPLYERAQAEADAIEVAGSEFAIDPAELDSANSGKEGESGDNKDIEPRVA